VIVRGMSSGSTNMHGSGGSDGATIWGAVLMKAPTGSNTMQFQIGGSTKVAYSSQAITMVTNKWGSAFSLNARIAAWNEVML